MPNPNLTPEEQAEIQLHVAGATVRHPSPFADLKLPYPIAEMSQEMRRRWVIPFYLKSLRTLAKEGGAFEEACREATPELVRTLLAEFNWRGRQVATRFVAVRRFTELQPDISLLFLRSDVCYVGADYTLTLAVLGNEAAAQTLVTYLNYYLRQPDLYFDQHYALAALLYFDEQHGTRHAAPVMPLWEAFIADKPHWNLQTYTSAFGKMVAEVHELQVKLEVG
ncbi:hypothetical protein EON80_06865 [bacterium]|nr:MAG: hypothetical protein EON80_06865 [bacterium]